jgi:hypothetical protein
MDTQRRRGRFAGGLAVMSMLAVATAAQVPDKPDFSGTWVLADPAGASPDAARTLTVTMSVVRQNVRGEPMAPFFDSLTVTRQFATEVRPDFYRIGIEGGTVSGSVGVIGGPACKTTYGVRWQDNRLVIEHASFSCGRDFVPDREHIEIWALDAEGRLTLSVTDRAPGIDTKTSTLTYRRN